MRAPPLCSGDKANLWKLEVAMIALTCVLRRFVVETTAPLSYLFFRCDSTSSLGKVIPLLFEGQRFLQARFICQ